MLNLNPNRKFRNPGFLPGNSEIQDSWQETQGFLRSQMQGLRLWCKNGFVCYLVYLGFAKLKKTRWLFLIHDIRRILKQVQDLLILQL